MVHIERIENKTMIKYVVVIKKLIVIVKRQRMKFLLVITYIFYNWKSRQCFGTYTHLWHWRG